MKLKGKFTIDTSGYPNNNPPGYTRSTQKSKWDEKKIIYEKWKDQVADCFKKSCNNLRLVKSQKSQLKVMIFYSNNRKSDPSNVFKGIEDALADKKIKYKGKVIAIDHRLYADDNWNSGAFDFSFDSDCPRVEVEIYY